jgi:hypothetical protein
MNTGKQRFAEWASRQDPINLRKLWRDRKKQKRSEMTPEDAANRKEKVKFLRDDTAKDKTIRRKADVSITGKHFPLPSLCLFRISFLGLHFAIRHTLL